MPPPSEQVPAYWKTRAEKSDYRLTADYAETMRFCGLLEARSRWVRVTNYGKSGQGRDLPLVILSKDRAFTPALARATGGLALALQTGTPVPFEACEALLKGMALVSLQAGDYIRRTNPPTASSNGHGVSV